MSASRQALDKALPVNLDAERSVIGAILIDNSAIVAALKQINSRDFFLEQHKTIFRRMLAMVDASEPIELVTLCEALGRNTELELAGGTAYIASLATGIPKVANTEHYAKIVREKSRLRTFIHLSENVQKMAFEPDADIESLRAKIHAGITEDAPIQKIVGGNGKLTYSLAEFLATEFPEPEHLIERLIPKSGTVMVVAMPHHLKSWFTTSIALAASVAGENVLGKLSVKKGVRTLLVQMEDFPGILKGRLTQLLSRGGFQNSEPNNVRIFPRCDFHLPDAAWYQRFLYEITNFKADLVILDVVRRIFRGDINSQKETTPFLEQLDSAREATGATMMLVHHENRKEADIMYASAGSYTLPSWAHVLIQFKRKVQEGDISHVEIEADNKLAQAPEPMRMVLDLSTETPVRLDSLEDTAGIQDLRDDLGDVWTVRDLREAMQISPTGAKRRIRKLIAAGIVEKHSASKSGRNGGLARYHFVGS